MSKKINIYVYPNNEGNHWLVKKHGKRRASYSFGTLQEAKNKANDLAKEMQSKVYVKDDNNKLKTKVDFSHRKGARNFHVEKMQDHWIVRADDRTYSKHKFKTKAEAIQRARKDAVEHHSVMVVHSDNGRIQKIQDLRGIPAPL